MCRRPYMRLCTFCLLHRNVPLKKKCAIAVKVKIFLGQLGES